LRSKTVIFSITDERLDFCHDVTARGVASHGAKSAEIREMKHWLTEIWTMLIGRVDGPLTFRFVFHPAVAAILAIRAGQRDARSGDAPFLWSVFTSPTHRRESLRDGWKDIGTVFMIAVLLDVTYALIVRNWLYPGQTLLVATIPRALCVDPRSCYPTDVSLCAEIIVQNDLSASPSRTAQSRIGY
jgi:hypothetical protein